MVALCCLLAVGAHPALADTLPAYCGAVGAKSYTPPAVTIPSVVLNRGTVITVTNATMAINGDTSSVKALVANPGPDGISIQEAILATNNDPGTWNIQFAPALKGSIIDTGNQGLIGLTGGNVTINGDIDGDGREKGDAGKRGRTHFTASLSAAERVREKCVRPHFLQNHKSPRGRESPIHQVRENNKSLDGCRSLSHTERVLRRFAPI